MRRTFSSTAAVLTVALSFFAAGCAPSVKSDSVGSEESAAPAQEAGIDEADISDLCGDKPLTVALADGYGGSTWRKIVLAELKDEASKCPTIENVLYSNANADPQKAIADINGFVAQGVDILIVFPDFGDAELPALRAATKAGVTVVPYFNKINGQAGVDYAANVTQDARQIGVDMGDWFGANVKSGEVALMGGGAGSTSSSAMYEGLKESLANYPSLKLVGDSYVVTDYNAVKAQQAMVGLITQYPNLAGVATDYGVTTLAAVKAFKAAGKKIPAMAETAGHNELYCAWKPNGKFPLLALERTTTLVRNALRRGMAEFQGIDLDEPLTVRIPVSIDTAAGDTPPCDESAPADADLFSGLSKEQLQEVFGQ